MPSVCHVKRQRSIYQLESERVVPPIQHWSHDAGHFHSDYLAIELALEGELLELVPALLSAYFFQVSTVDTSTIVEKEFIDPSSHAGSRSLLS
jgi:hypothetical protein